MKIILLKDVKKLGKNKIKCNCRIFINNKLNKVFIMENNIEKQTNFIKEPQDCYFIHGIKKWNKKDSIRI